MAGQSGQAAMPHACEQLEVRIRRFPRSYRRRLRKLVRGSKPLKDLLYSFPAATFLLAAGCRASDVRGRTVRLVKTGRPLPEAAASLGLPMWTRRLPPEAFAQPFSILPADRNFERRIVNLIPKSPEAASMWLRWVSFAGEACDSKFALWVAGQKIFAPENGDGIPLLPLAAFAWFSRQRGEVAHRLIETPWHHKMRFFRAVSLTRVWLERVVVEYCLEDTGRSGGWFKARKSCGFHFVPLRSAEELREEGERMENCVGSYAEHVATGACLIYSIRRGGKHIATMEIAPNSRPPGTARLAQIYGPANRVPEKEVVHAARAWLSKRGKYPLTVRNGWAQVSVYAGRWEAIWESYCESKPQMASYVLPANTGALLRLQKDLNKLERMVEQK